MSSLNALFEGMIDYAGLFPPAELPMEEAFATYVEHRRTGNGWMLARFVCPAPRLEELEEQLSTTNEDTPLSVAVLGRGGDTLEAFLESVREDAASISAFADRHEGRVVADTFEVKLPAAGGAAVAVNDAAIALNHRTARAVTPFFETPMVGDWRQLLPAAAAATRDADRQAEGAYRVGLKIRCGGLEASAVPEPMAVAAAIAICRSVGVPLKATQGLHHPFRRHDDTLGTEAHGFVNLFVASILAWAHDLPVAQLTHLIAETDRDAFTLTDEKIGWRDWVVGADEVEVSRKRLLTSFGSCSFSEPCDDLRAAGLID
jgi:hypothetical protein